MSPSARVVRLERKSSLQLKLGQPLWYWVASEAVAEAHGLARSTYLVTDNIEHDPPIPNYTILEDLLAELDAEESA